MGSGVRCRGPAVAMRRYYLLMGARVWGMCGKGTSAHSRGAAGVTDNYELKKDFGLR